MSYPSSSSRCREAIRNLRLVAHPEPMLSVSAGPVARRRTVGAPNRSGTAFDSWSKPEPGERYAGGPATAPISPLAPDRCSHPSLTSRPAPRLTASWLRSASATASRSRISPPSPARYSPASPPRRTGSGSSAFDLLAVAGEDVRVRPWEDRDACLRETLPVCERIRLAVSQPASWRRTRRSSPSGSRARCSNAWDRRTGPDDTAPGSSRRRDSRRTPSCIRFTRIATAAGTPSASSMTGSPAERR